MLRSIKKTKILNLRKLTKGITGTPMNTKLAGSALLNQAKLIRNASFNFNAAPNNSKLHNEKADEFGNYYEARVNLAEERAHLVSSILFLCLVLSGTDSWCF